MASRVVFFEESIFEFKKTLEEIHESKQTFCATLSLDNSGQDLVNRVANVVYEDCRSGRLSLPGLPQFQPLLQALKNGQTSNTTKSFRVSTQIHDQLLVLESYARRWTEDEQFAEKAKSVISAHNEEFNNTGDFWISERRAYQTWLVISKLSFNKSKWVFANDHVRFTNGHTFIREVLLNSALDFSFQLHMLASRLGPGCRSANDPAAETSVEEPPAKRIKIEQCSTEEVSKVENPLLGLRNSFLPRYYQRYHLKLLCETQDATWKLFFLKTWDTTWNVFE